MARHQRREELSIIKPIFIPAVRKWLYGVATVAIPLLVAYGMLEESKAPLWVALAAQIFATGTAYLHTPKESVGTGG